SYYLRLRRPGRLSLPRPASTAGRRRGSHLTPSPAPSDAAPGGATSGGRPRCCATCRTSDSYAATGTAPQIGDRRVIWGPTVRRCRPHGADPPHGYAAVGGNPESLKAENVRRTEGKTTVCRCGWRPGSPSAWSWPGPVLATRRCVPSGRKSPIPEAGATPSLRGSPVYSPE